MARVGDTMKLLFLLVLWMINGILAWDGGPISHHPLPNIRLRPSACTVSSSTLIDNSALTIDLE
jgi:hypothetical protein